LDEVRDLLISQIELLKKGEFPDWLIPAIINDLKLRRIKEYESKDYDFIDNGITLKMKGSGQIAKIDIAIDLMDKDSKDMLEDMLMIAINKATTKLSADKDLEIERIQKTLKSPF
jgi:DNA-binding protein YbaB